MHSFTLKHQSAKHLGELSPLDHCMDTLSLDASVLHPVGQLWQSDGDKCVMNMLEVLTGINLAVPKTPQHLLTQWPYREGAKIDGYRIKRNVGTILFSFTKIHYFTYLSCTDLNILHLYKEPSFMLMSEMILDKSKY